LSQQCLIPDMRIIQFAVLVIMFSTPLIAQNICLEGEVKMLALGDSYTIGESVEIDERWPHQLMDKLRALTFEGMDPDYIATTGWTTQNLIQGMNSMLDDELSYNLVSILIGVNNQYQGVPIESYEPDLRKIIDLALKVVQQDTSNVFILSIPDYAYTPFGGGADIISREIDEYNEIKRRVAAEYKVAFIDITPISREGLSNSSLLADDGLHPSEVQYGQWVEAIIPRVRLKEYLPSGALQQIPANAISVYPNPAGATVQIDSLEEITRIRIINSTGSIVSDQKISASPARLDLSYLGSGLYTLWIDHGNQNAVSYRTLLI